MGVPDHSCTSACPDCEARTWEGAPAPGGGGPKIELKTLSSYPSRVDSPQRERPPGRRPPPQGPQGGTPSNPRGGGLLLQWVPGGWSRAQNSGPQTSFGPVISPMICILEDPPAQGLLPQGPRPSPTCPAGSAAGLGPSADTPAPAAPGGRTSISVAWLCPSQRSHILGPPTATPYILPVPQGHLNPSPVQGSQAVH